MLNILLLRHAVLRSIFAVLMNQEILVVVHPVVVGLIINNSNIPRRLIMRLILLSDFTKDVRSPLLCFIPEFA